MEERIKIELSLQDAELFKLFRKYQDPFKQLLDNGVFEPLNGSKIIHKDGLKIRMIETRTIKRM